MNERDDRQFAERAVTCPNRNYDLRAHLKERGAGCPECGDT